MVVERWQPSKGSYIDSFQNNMEYIVYEGMAAASQTPTLS